MSRTPSKEQVAKAMDTAKALWAPVEPQQEGASMQLIVTTRSALVEIAIGVGTGVVVGLAGGLLLTVADARKWTSPVSRKLLVPHCAL